MMSPSNTFLMEYQFTNDAARVLKKARIREEILATRFFPFITDTAQVLEKARIREEILAWEASENCMLEQEVFREHELEQKMTRRLPGEQRLGQLQPVICEEILAREASDNSTLEEKVRRKLELQRKITMKLQEEQRLNQLQPVIGEEIMTGKFFPVTKDAVQVLKKARIREAILAREASENRILEEEVLRELELEQEKTRNLQVEQRLGQLQPVTHGEILAWETSQNRMLEEEVLRELELERKITRKLQEEEVRHELELERKMSMKLKEEQRLSQLQPENKPVIMDFEFSTGFGDRHSTVLPIPPVSGYDPHGLTGDQVWEMNKARMLDGIIARQADETRMIKDEVQRELHFSSRMAQRLHEIQLIGLLMRNPSNTFPMEYQFTNDAARVLKKERIREEILATRFFPFITDTAQVLEKARIREEILAWEASENRMLEEEVFRELELEQKMTRKLPGEQHPGQLQPVICEEILAREASHNRKIEEKVRRKLELQRNITMKLREEQRLSQLQPVIGEEIMTSEFFPVTTDAVQVLKKARIREAILAMEASEKCILEEEVLHELELEQKKTRTLQVEQRLGQLQPVTHEEILARETSQNRMLEEEVLRELELERKITRKLQEEEVRNELELERKMSMKLKEEQRLSQLQPVNKPAVMDFQFSTGFGDRHSTLLPLPPLSSNDPHGLTGDQVWEMNKERMSDGILARQAEETRMIKDEAQRELHFSRRMAQRLHEIQLIGQFPMPAPDRSRPYPSETRVGDVVMAHGLDPVVPVMIPTHETVVRDKPSLPIDHGVETTIGDPEPGGISQSSH